MAIFAPLIAPYSFDTYQDAAGRFPTQGEPTDRNHWGTTVQGFDVMSRTIYGARTAVEVVFLAVDLLDRHRRAARARSRATSAAGWTASWS